MTKEIKLTKGFSTIVDDEDYEYLNKWNWCYSEGYAKRRKGEGGNSLLRMHRVINNTPSGFETDHINGNKLDNRKCNLRAVTRSQNIANTFPQKVGISKYKGVCWDKERKRWKAQIKAEGIKYNIGRYRDEMEAALAYDTYANRLFGEFARLNFND